ncbi:MAG: 23S rRNA (adenine(2030)-N(6))-methyltransferase RlmJ [Verrucomicrobia bacterium]|nr:23S rRNA (adenine(2030)-N(6))-methyltransferase RlmJ [Verrucomicrobiota bacterium]
MNYRHQFHAANFADVMKHVLLLRLLRAMQKKEKGFLFLDTHAGRGVYDLAAAAQGDSLARKPEWPDGIGRLAGDAEWPAPVAEYLELVREFQEQQAGAGEGSRFYPGSPWFAARMARAQDRLAVCERQPEEFLALAAELRRVPRAAVHEMDGYTAVRAMLPPPERRALVLIDPPYEAQNEFARIVRALADGLRRLPAGVFAVWYPLTQRARLAEFFGELRAMNLPPTVALELMIAGDESPIKLRGCGLLVVNPPWQFEVEVRPALELLAKVLAQGPGDGARVEWIVAER